MSNLLKINIVIRNIITGKEIKPINQLTSSIPKINSPLRR
jgi:hypothetical protein